MKKLLLVGLMMLAGSAWAEWVMFDLTKEVTFYYLISNERQPIELSAGGYGAQQATLALQMSSQHYSIR